MRPNASWREVLFLLLLALIISFVAAVIMNGSRKDCESRGGEYHYNYALKKSECNEP